MKKTITSINSTKKLFTNSYINEYNKYFNNYKMAIVTNN